MTDLPQPEQPEVTYKQRVNPLLKNLPEYVKDPRNFEKIELSLIKTLRCDKLHSDPLKMAECKKCTENMKVRRELMKKYGFSSYAVYMAWKQIHTEIKKRMPLEKYNEMVKQNT